MSTQPQPKPNNPLKVTKPPPRTPRTRSSAKKGTELLNALKEGESESALKEGESESALKEGESESEGEPMAVDRAEGPHTSPTPQSLEKPPIQPEEQQGKEKKEEETQKDDLTTAMEAMTITDIKKKFVKARREKKEKKEKRKYVTFKVPFGEKDDFKGIAKGAGLKYDQEEGYFHIGSGKWTVPIQHEKLFYVELDEADREEGEEGEVSMWPITNRDN